MYHDLAQMLIRDVIAAHPDAATVFEKHGLGCASCMAADMETVRAAAQIHEVPLDDLLTDLEALWAQEEPFGRELQG